MSDRTIAAISTPFGVGGISVIRISGSRAFEICDKIFYGKTRISDAQTHTVHYGYIKDINGEMIDEVLVTVMRAPKSYTREDVAEISTHGGLTASKSVLKCVIEAGAYPAEPGEFTKRAFLNGRIDLSQAEAVIDIINSKTTLAQKNALSQSRGGLSEEITKIRDDLINLAASMQVIIDYPDEELEDVTIDDIYERAKINKLKTEKLIASSENGKIIKDGIKTVICGKPNVGKSSLLNLLAKEDRAIVTDVAGTTRDVIEESVNIDGVPLILTDTAGIRETEDAIEKIGVLKTYSIIENADLIIVMFDASRELDEDETKIWEMTSDKKRIALINKCDIKDSSSVLKIDKLTSGENILISAKTGEGTQKLIEKIKQMYSIGDICAADEPVVTNLRHIAALERAKESLGRVMESIDGGMPSDIASIDINIAIDALGEITGAVVSDDIVSAIFHGFCVGK